MEEKLFAYAYQSPYSLHSADIIDITRLVNLLKQLSNQWADDRGVYSVEVMLLIGEVINETRKVIE